MMKVLTCNIHLEIYLLKFDSILLVTGTKRGPFDKTSDHTIAKNHRSYQRSDTDDLSYICCLAQLAQGSMDLTKMTLEPRS